MKKIWRFLRDHVREDFNLSGYLLIIIFLAVSIALNYIFDFEDNYLELMSGYSKFIAYFFFYSIPYLLVTYIYARTQHREGIFQKKEFWIKSIFGVTILTLDSSAPYLEETINHLFHPQIQFWAYKVSINSISFFTVAIPILIFYYINDRHQKHIYGLSAYKFDARPYFTMLLIMLPLIIAASFNESFLRQYPMYKTSRAHIYLDIPEWVTVACYEVAYGLDFITVEYLFRGFFVIGVMGILGRGAVVTMAVIYCYLHFGKPAGEAISSFFGGYILGVVAYETRSIWGGIIVHMGIAWMMEVVSFVSKMNILD